MVNKSCYMARVANARQVNPVSVPSQTFNLEFGLYGHRPGKQVLHLADVKLHTTAVCLKTIKY